MTDGPPRLERRALMGLVITVVGLALLAAADRWVAQQLPTRGRLSDNVENVRLDPDEDNLVILGTCLSEQHINVPVLEQALGPSWRISNLGAAATTPVEWYLAWKNHLPQDRIDVLAIAFGRFDLTEPMTPWESETLDLAKGEDMSEIIAVSCETTECRLDLELQRRSALWRYRPVVAALVWHRLGLAPPTDPRDARLRVVEGLRSKHANHWDPLSPSVVYLEKLVSEAKAAGTEVVFVQLPLRPAVHDTRDQELLDALDRGLDGLVQRNGAHRLPDAGLDASVYVDDVHMTAAGVAAFTEFLGQQLPPVIALNGGD